MLIISHTDNQQTTTGAAGKFIPSKSPATNSQTNAHATAAHSAHFRNMPCLALRLVIALCSNFDAIKPVMKSKLFSAINIK